jgi:beta-N-acetylhexosaminidase
MMQRWARSVGRWGFVLSVLLWLTACAGRTVTVGVAAPTATPATANSDNVTLQQKAAAIDPEAAINRIIAHMTLDEKIGQLMMVEFLGTDYNTDLDGMINGAAAGGLIIYNNNTRTIPQMQQLLAQVQAHAKIPVMISLDQEGGDVNRLSEFYGPAPSAAYLGSLGNPTLARNEGALDASRLLNLGFNNDLAPVVDVSDDQNDLEGPRLWADTPGKVTLMAGAYLNGLQQAGVAGCLKHWPGIGSLHAGQDPHELLPTITHDLPTLTSIDFAPFKNLLAQGPAMIMPTDVLVPAIDPVYPAEISPKLINGVLRGQLGYQGMIITDQLIMKGIQDTWPLGEAGVLAVLAGDDMLEGGFDTNSTWEMINAIQAAVASGRVPLATIEASDRRILRVKWAYGMGLATLMQLAGPDPTPTGAGKLAADTAISVGVAVADRRH